MDNRVLIDGRVLKHKAVTGVERYSIEVINGLKKLAPDDIDIVFPQSNNRYLQHIWEHTILPKRASDYKVLFCPANMCPIFKPKGVKFITTIHDISFIDYPQSFSLAYRMYYTMLTKNILKISDFLITVSHFSKNRIIEQYPFTKDKISVIYSGINDLFFQRDDIHGDGDFILYVGNLNKIKNFLGVLRAFSKIYKKINKKMIVVGMKPNTMRLDSEIKNVIGSIPKGFIEFKGQINDVKILKSFYKRAFVFLFPSFHESFGFPPLEAMASGCPVIVSNRGALPEICGSAALYVDPLNIDDVCDKIVMVEKNDELRLKLIEKGKERSKKFSWQESSAKHMLLIKEFL